MLAVAAVPIFSRALSQIPLLVMLLLGVAILASAAVLLSAARRTFQAGRTRTAEDTTAQGCLVMLLGTLGLSLTLSGLLRVARAAGVPWVGWSILAGIALVSLLLAMTIAQNNVPSLLRAVGAARGLPNCVFPSFPRQLL